MKKNLSFYSLIIIAITICNLHFVLAQNPGQWVWISGDNVPGNPGVWGTQGVSSPTNVPPALYCASRWTDMNGKFWLYGGITGTGHHGDLWYYDPSINEWTWMKGAGIVNDTGVFGTQGIASPLNRPPSVAWGHLTWTDLNNNLWMFGGISDGYHHSNDLWKYSISTNEWTWVKGPGTFNTAGNWGIQGVPSPFNNPDGRQEIVTNWVDSDGNFWFFGGVGIYSAHHNDVWKYDISTNEWTWMKGSSSPNPPGFYGLQGLEHPGHSPEGRWSWSTWKDNEGMFWMLGGFDSLGRPKNDLWRFNPLTNNWAWINGTDSFGIDGVDGNICVLDTGTFPSQTPECRAVWNDPNGDLLIRCIGSTYWKALWKYCVSSNKWVVINGDSLHTQAGNWGTKGVCSPTNMPPLASGSLSWSDKSGHLYMFGGQGGVLNNSLWMYTLDPCCAPCDETAPDQSFSASDTTICPGTCIDMINNSQSYSFYQWFFQGGNPSASNDLSPQNICYNVPGIYDVTLIANRCNGIDTLTLMNYINVFSQPFPQSISQNGDTLFAISGTPSYQWYYNGNIIPGATDYFIVATASGDYNVVATDSNGCEVEAVINNVIASSQFAVPSLQFAIYPNPVKDRFRIQNAQYMIGTAKIEYSIYNLMGEKVKLPFDQSQWIVDCGSLPSGIYYIEVIQLEKIFRAKFVKQ